MFFTTPQNRKGKCSS